jgi:hypothetical protein
LFPLFAIGNVDIGGKNLLSVSTTPMVPMGIFTTGVVDTGGRGARKYLRKYLREFSKKFKITLTLFSGAWGKMKARLIQLAICLRACLTWSLPAPQQGVRIKGTVPRDFRLQVFFMDQFPPRA